MSNKQTRSLRKINVSSRVQKGCSTSLHDFDNNRLPGLTFVEYPAGKQPSRRTSKWGLKLVKSDRVIVYPEEFKKHGTKK